MIESNFFIHNRARIPADQIFIIAGNEAVQATNDMAAPFAQESNFWYLTGIEEPGWWLLLAAGQSILVAPSQTDIHKIFNGGLDAESAKAISGVDEVMNRRSAVGFIKQLASSYDSVLTVASHPHAKHFDFHLNPGPLAMNRRLKRLFKQVEDYRPQLVKLRAIKQPIEIEAIRRAIDLTVDAFDKVRGQLQELQYEYEAEASFTSSFRSAGSPGHAYEPIIASGKNACTLHYAKNQDRLHKNQLLLMDVGARVDGYAADITRTYSVGQTSERQAQVHAAVESAHKDIIALLRPGLLVIEYHDKVDAIMKSKLEELGQYKNPEDYRRYFPHAISHGLGIDVHDALGNPESFEVGMVLTVEPGIYIPEEGIGVRIEDDILITKDGHENLSAALPTSL